MPIDYPELSSRVKKLEKEHVAILALLQATIEQAAGLGTNPEDSLSRELAAQVRRLAAKVRRHKAAETDLVMASHWNTLGTAD